MIDAGYKLKYGDRCADCGTGRCEACHSAAWEACLPERVAYYRARGWVGHDAVLTKVVRDYDAAQNLQTSDK